ncbi:hypothetical protein [Flavobacterium sp.]|uniref:hypothetical protein n=1 Tax=Flavobacterium sp. TaxID=239 RepID=UPI003D26A09F
MKKYIFIFIAYVALSTSANAQSDATLEETIEWLNNFGFSYFGETQCGLPVVGKHPIFYIMQRKHESNKVVFSKSVEVDECETALNDRYKTCYTSANCNILTYHLYADELKSMTISKDSRNLGITIYDIKGRYFHYRYDHSEEKIMERTLKALKHLFKLLNLNITIEDKRSLENKF